MSHENDNCRKCGKSDADSPRRRFSEFAGGGLLGVCIACELEHNRKVAEERTRLINMNPPGTTSNPQST